MAFSQRLPILHIWEFSHPRTHQRHEKLAVVAIRKSKDGFEVSEGVMRFSGCSYGRGGHHTGYAWKYCAEVKATEAEAIAFVLERYPNRRDGSAALKKLREKRGTPAALEGKE